MSTSFDPISVAIQGELGSNSALAAEQFFATEVTIVPCTAFTDLFEAVATGRALYGMAPVENSLAGSIHDVWHLLAEHPLPVSGEIYFHVNHCLIAHPGVQLDELRYIHSHEQALAQCQNFLLGLKNAQQKAAYDTAGAVQLIKENGWKDAAAIAPEQAALNHDMAVLARNIQTNPVNYTRFLVLAHQKPAAANAPTKTTLILQVNNLARDLPTLLTHLHKQRIETDKVETRKRLGHPWEYLIYLELLANAGDEHIAAAIEELGLQAQNLHLVGTYPAATRPKT